MIFPLRLFILLLTIACVSTGAAARADSLPQLLHDAEAADPLFEVARLEWEVSVQQFKQSEASLFPSFVAEAGKNYSDTDSRFNGSATSNRRVNSWNWDIKMTQTLLNIANGIAYSQAETRQLMAEIKVDLARQDMITRVARAYFEVLIAEEAIEALVAQGKAIGEQLAQATKGFELGAATKTDILEAQARLDAVRAQQVTAQNEITGKRIDLEKIVGRRVYKLAPLREIIALPMPSHLRADDWANEARDHALQVQIQRLAVSIAAEDVTRFRSAHAPVAEFVATYGKNNSQSSSAFGTMVNDNLAYQLSMQVTVPIWSGGAAQARVGESTALLAKARASLDATQRDAAANAVKALTGISNGIAQIEAYARAVESGTLAVQANRAGYRLGTRTNVDVLNAEQQLFANRRDLTRARYDTLMQLLALKAAVGSLGDEEIAALDHYFQQ